MIHRINSCQPFLAGLYSTNIECSMNDRGLQNESSSTGPSDSRQNMERQTFGHAPPRSQDFSPFAQSLLRFLARQLLTSLPSLGLLLLLSIPIARAGAKLEQKLEHVEAQTIDGFFLHTCMAWERCRLFGAADWPGLRARRKPSPILPKLTRFAHRHRRSRRASIPILWHHRIHVPIPANKRWISRPGYGA